MNVPRPAAREPSSATARHAAMETILRGLRRGREFAEPAGSFMGFTSISEVLRSIRHSAGRGARRAVFPASCSEQRTGSIVKFLIFYVLLRYLKCGGYCQVRGWR